ncbi:MAG: ComF family protein, partial [Cyanothece sp. SIO2G6]|nr:ComF family protein [Cyanothece sp. SIO2G6]
AALKYDNQPQLARFLGVWMGQQWLASPMAQMKQGRSLIVVPVPANAAKKKRRGYDQAELLAAAFCQYTRLPLDLRRVIRTTDTVPMFGLSLTERQQNVQGTFQLHPRFRPAADHARQSVLLLDDIYTTGSTMKAIAHLLRQHRMSVYGAITLAKAGLSDAT